MKTRSLLASCLVLGALPVAAQVLQFNTGVLTVPDGPGGLVNVQQVAGTFPPLSRLRVQFDVSGPDGFVGDLFVTLQHESGAYAVLLNRPGRDTTTPDGYAERGLSITFDAAAPDVHRYRELGGPPPGEILAGSWSPDGRITDPAAVLPTDPRPASFGSFSGIDPAGEWILFLADVNPGGQIFLDRWALDFTPIPEPTMAAFAAGGLLLLVAAGKRWLWVQRKLTR